MNLYKLLALALALAGSALEVSAQNADPIELTQDMKSFVNFASSLDARSVKESTYIDLQVRPEAFAVFTMDGTSTADICKGEMRRLTGVRNISIAWQSKEDNSSYKIAFLLWPDDPHISAWTDVACIYAGNPESGFLRIRGHFSVKYMNPFVQGFDYLLTAVGRSR